MFQLDRVQDLETLRKAAKILERENEKLVAKNVALLRENLQLKGADESALQLKLADLERQLAAVRKKIFGVSTERRSHEGAPRSGDEEKKTPASGHGPREQLELQVVEQIHELDEADKTCSACGEELLEWKGQFEESEEVDVIRRVFLIRKHRKKKYRCECRSHVETALGPTKLIPGGRYSTAFAIEVAVQKYLDHLPLERQVKIMKREGLVVDSQTLWDQIQALARVLEPVSERLASHVRSQPVVGADETRWQLLGAPDGETTRWQVWTVVAPNAVHYKILDSRSAAAAKEILGGYRGIVMADGYGAYESLAKSDGGFVVAHCWAHVRRKFLDIEEFFPAQAKEILAKIGELYEIERICPTGPPGDELRAELRKTKSRAIVREIQEWLIRTRALPQSGLGRAIAYAIGIWTGLVRFLDDARIPLDNNAAERAMRGPVIGRKNHYGSKSRRGTEVAALFYSLVETAKLNGIDPDDYIQITVDAIQRGQGISLPHEIAATLAEIRGESADAA